MIVSFLTPSRNRVELLKESVASLGKGDFEVLVCIDPDEPQMAEYKKVRGIKLFIAPERWGYANLHEYSNLLAKEAKGDFLANWNDDAVMLSEGWIEKIAAFDHTVPQVLNPWNPIDNLLPLISRAWYEATGHFAPNTHVDSWVQQTAEIDGRTTYVPGIDLKHYGEEMNDETHQQAREVVGQTSEAYRKMGELRLQDARKVSDYIARGGWNENHREV
jgi:hypothetical protein